MSRYVSCKTTKYFHPLIVRYLIILILFYSDLKPSLGLNVLDQITPPSYVVYGCSATRVRTHYLVARYIGQSQAQDYQLGKAVDLSPSSPIAAILWEGGRYAAAYGITLHAVS